MKTLLAALCAVVALGLTAGNALADNTGFVSLLALHDSHADDTFYSLDVFQGLGKAYPIRPYLDLFVQRDSQQLNLLLPQPLNDNYGLLAGGMQYQNRAGLRVFAQIGDAFAFGPQAPFGWYLKHNDFRAGVEDFRNWNDGLGAPRRAIGSFYGSAVYYSRYENAVFYVAAERGREYGASEHPVQLYGRLSANGDTRRFFYNNSANATLGARVLPLGHRGPSLAVEESYNTYVGPGAPIAATGYSRQYFSLRPILSFGASF
jgi:hypothetical protein